MDAGELTIAVRAWTTRDRRARKRTKRTGHSPPPGYVLVFDTETTTDATQELTIGERQGSFPGMLSSRTFNLVVVGAAHGAGPGITQAPDETVSYTGAELVVPVP